MSKIQNLDFTLCFFFSKRSHSLCKRAGITDGCSFLDAGSEGYGIGSSSEQFSYAKRNLFPRTSAAVSKANQFDFSLYSLKTACSFSNCFKVCSTGTVILRLHTTYNSNFHSFLSPYLVAVQSFDVIIHNHIIF